MIYILQKEHSGNTIFWTCKDQAEFMNLSANNSETFETFYEALEAQHRNYANTVVWFSPEDAWEDRKRIPEKHWKIILSDLPSEVFLSEFKFVKTVEEPEEIHEEGDRTGYCEYRNPDNLWIKVCWYVDNVEGFSIQYCDSEYEVDGIVDYFEADVKAKVMGGSL